MQISPLFDRILVAPIPEGSVTKGGLLIPAIAAQSRVFCYGDVTAVGTGRVNAEGKLIPLTLKVGDTVMFQRKAGVPVSIPAEDGEDTQLLMTERDILAVVTGLPRDSGIRGLDGRILAMMPTSRGLPDSVYANRDAADVAEREGWAAPGELGVDEVEPGDARL